jgi:hypothetical protein
MFAIVSSLHATWPKMFDVYKDDFIGKQDNDSN